MGSGGAKKPLPEIDETRATMRDDAFEAIIERIKSSGADIVSDEESPLYTDIGMDQFELGIIRTIIFNLNKMDFKLMRRVEEFSIQGAGHQKHLEELKTPRVKISLMQKRDTSDDWQTVDLDNMF